MNSLSWFLYFIQIADVIRSLAEGVMVITFIAIIIWLLISGVAAAEDEFDIWNGLKGFLRGYAILIFLLAGMVTIFVPSRQTLLLIAGSEIGERVVKSEDVRSVINPGLDLLKAWIKAETEKFSPKPKKEIDNAQP